ncbi:MAG: glycerol-3-phosphate dehydrogenase [Alphaproteobacteria bacterium]|nr:glycerol-3-phosphate dehydrogenase [Alphaproteobacteria bacterium]
MDYDLCIIGGGINGVGIARDAAGRGLKVLLVEAQDLGSATSSASTKLIHGGLRYLEHYEFNLVKESLHEREVLLNAAPHIIWPLRFVLPHHSSLRPIWMIRLGLFLYDRLAGRKKLQKSEHLDFNVSKVGDPLKDNFKEGFEYSDCWVDDARLVVLNAVDAQERGADILPHTACVHMEEAPVSKDAQSGWCLHLQNMMSGDQFQVKAKMIVNAAGPWVRGILEGSNLVEDYDGTPGIRLVQGSHIVVPKLYEGDHPYILQQDDKRIVFSIPYEGQYTLIGTTDKTFAGDASQAIISEEEIEYLINAINQSFEKQISKEDIVWTYSGVRSLVEDGHENASEVTRDYKLFLKEHHGAPILSVFGGKLTTYRTLAEDVLGKVSLTFKAHGYKEVGKPWTAEEALPGGDMPYRSFDAYMKLQKPRYGFLPESLIYRYARAYGTRMEWFLNSVHKVDDLGRDFGDQIYEAEILYLIKHEFAHTAEDVLWRRSKLGLHIKRNTAQAVEAAMPELLERVQAEKNQKENGHDKAACA